MVAMSKNPVLTDLVETLMFAKTEETKEVAHHFIRTLSEKRGIFTASIQDLYDAMGRGEVRGFTVPAINVRGMVFEFAKAILRTAKKHNSRAFIFELAKSEMGYTEQKATEFAGLILAAAVAEGWKGPIFIQGDHFQFSEKKFKENPQAELDGIKKLTTEAVKAGYMNIDIDASTLVDLKPPTIPEQQKHNIEMQAAMIEFIRKIQPLEISIGGEIGEVGKKNSTVEEFEAFASGVKERVPNLKFMSKVSIQTGTAHGGNVLPDGTVGDFAIDFNAHVAISKSAREKFGMAGTVQHGASTLPLDKFHHFPPTGCIEIHLATEFQNIIYQHLPEDFKREIHGWIKDNLRTEFSAKDTEEQNLYKLRKKAWGPFKKQFAKIDPARYVPALEERLEKMFQLLNVKDTAPIVEKYIKTKSTLPPPPEVVKHYTH
jgi:fructose/tagatose bisphosphate aldolase